MPQNYIDKIAELEETIMQLKEALAPEKENWNFLILPPAEKTILSILFRHSPNQISGDRLLSSLVLLGYERMTKRSVAVLQTEPAAILFVNEAYKHCKTIAFGKETEAFVALTNIHQHKEKDPAVIYEQQTNFATAFITSIAKHRVWELEEVRNNPA